MHTLQSVLWRHLIKTILTLHCSNIFHHDKWYFASTGLSWKEKFLLNLLVLVKGMIITRSDMNTSMTFKHKSSVLKYLYYVMTNKANSETVILRLFLEIVPLLQFSKHSQARKTTYKEHMKSILWNIEKIWKWRQMSFDFTHEFQILILLPIQ